MGYRDHLAEATEVSTPTDVRFGIRAASAAHGHAPFLLSDVGRPGHRVALNAARRSDLERAWGISGAALLRLLAKAMEEPASGGELSSDEAAVLEHTMAEVDLTRLPIPWHHAEDAGPYISAGVVVAASGAVRNASYHRMLVRDPTHLVARLVPRHLRRMVDEGRATGMPLDVAIVVGADPTVLIAAAMSFDYGRDELGVAAALHTRLHDRPLPLVRLPSGLRVPADAEYVLEATVTLEDDDEGPYVDITGTLDHVRQQPVLEVHTIHHRTDPIFHAILPAQAEHLTLMGLPRAPFILAAVDAVVPCTDVHLTDGGSGWLAGVVSIQPHQDGDGVRAIEAALAGHPSMKQVTVVDDDIDITDPVAVEWAVLTRSQPDVDLHIVRDARGSSLDPTRRADGTTSKLGIDATLALGVDRSLFRRVA